MTRRVSWLDVDRGTRDYSFHDYMQIVAHARYVFRKVQRIIERRHARTSRPILRDRRRKDGLVGMLAVGAS